MAAVPQPAVPHQQLLAALNGGEYERAVALVGELHSAEGLADEDGTPVLILACALSESAGHGDEDDDDEPEPVDEDAAVAACRTRVVRALLAKRAAVDGVDAQGRSALLMSVLRGDEPTVRALLEASPNLLQRPSAEGMRMSALGAAAAYGSDGVRALVEAAAERAGLAAVARQESLAASCSALLDAVVEGAELRMVQSTAGAGDFEVASALALLELLGIDAEREIEANGDPLAHAVAELYARAPLVHRKAWRDAEALSPADLGVVLSLHCMGEADGRPMLDKLAEPYVARAAGSRHWLVTPECHRFNTLCTRPLMRTFSSAVPSGPALDALVRVGKQSGFVELGCGSGYWARLLRQRGVAVDAYDLKPPQDDADGEGIFGTTWIDDVRQGGPEVLLAPGAASKALLLVWPYEGVGSSGWDAECLDRYAGDTVCYVGDWQGCTRSHRPVGMTSSAAFQQRLYAHFVCVERTAVGKWAMVADTLSVWRRRRAGEPGGGGCGPLVPSPDEHCRNCHLDRAAPGGVGEECWPDEDGGTFCSADCAALHNSPAAKRRRDECAAAEAAEEDQAARDRAACAGGGGAVRERDAAQQGLWWKSMLAGEAGGGTPAPAGEAAVEPAVAAAPASFSFGF